jgi:N-acetylmuramoyl-L-alanine amidase
MKNIILVLALLTGLSGLASAQEVTGLAGWNIFLDPGHSRQENQGAFGYSEAENVLRVGLRLRDMLLEETDIDTVYLSRTNDTQLVGLTQRTDLANSLGADFFHSIHSNAAAPNVNHLFILWAQLRSGNEPAPPFNGGRLMAETMGPVLAQGMRIPAVYNGAVGECTFYGTTSCRLESTTPKGSRNHVQSFSMMPSALSEAGFHTNPVQNQRKMNGDWPRLEARAMLWSIYDYHEIERPAVRIATGIISDTESGMPINGATITIGDLSYTTDTYETVFYQFTSDPDLLRNGFYYLEGLPHGGPFPVTVEADGYATYSGTVTLADDFFTFRDISLLSTVPPVVVETQPLQGQENFRIIDPITILFSRPMNRASVEQAFSIAPAVNGSFAWQNNDRRLVFSPEGLDPLTEYTVTIAEGALGAAGDSFDGNADGQPGGEFTLTFTTGFPDTEPPRIVASSPAFGSTGVELRPLITVTYDERIDHDSVEGLVSLAPTAGGPGVDGDVVVYDVRDRSTVSFFPTADLLTETAYRLSVQPGVSDLFGNEQPSMQQVRFTTGALEWAITSIDDFESNLEQYWWAPQQSGSTSGIITDSTARGVDTDIVNLLTSSTASMRLDYGWDVPAGGHLIRVHLGSGPPRDVTFGHDKVMQAFVFGDGGGSEFAFSVRDARAATAPVGRSPWYTVDWYGWRLVSWDIGQNPPALWAGTGEFGPPYRMESLQLRYAADAEPFGTIYFDDLRLATAEPAVSTQPVAGAPGAFRVHPNFPNPFSSTTTIRFDLPESTEVNVRVYNVLGAEVARLAADAVLPAGTRELVWDASSLAAGVYFLRVSAGEHSGSLRMLLVR